MYLGLNGMGTSGDACRKISSANDSNSNKSGRDNRSNKNGLQFLILQQQTNSSWF